MSDVETGTNELLASRLGGVLVVTLNRPEVRNALTDAMLEALAYVLTNAAVDSDVRCVVLTGAGDGFCAGGDVRAMARLGGTANASPDGETLVERQRLVQRETAGRLFTMPKPTIAMLNGAAAGAGLALALACDLRIMSASAVLVTAFAKVGLPGDFGGSYFLSKLVGTAKARELYYLSDRVSADEALRLGLANRVALPFALRSETLQLATRLATGPGVAFGYMKGNLNRAITGELGECLDLEATYHVACTQTHDHQEAARAFVEGRTPAFVGR